MPETSGEHAGFDLDGAFQALQAAVEPTMAAIEVEAAGLLNPIQEDDSHGAVTLAGLFKLLFDRARASRRLVALGMDWDADIILRAFYETMAKILRLCVSPDDQKANLLREFWIGESHNRRKKLRASWIERQAKPSDAVATAIFSFLQDDRITPVNPESTRAERQAIDQKWSFSGIVEYLSEHADKKFDLGNAKLLMHAYGMASHFVHSDHNALDLMEDRILRSLDDRRLVEAAHAARILTDQVSLAFLCSAALSIHLNTPLADKKAIMERVQACLALSEPITRAFYDGQQAFYEHYGYTFSGDEAQ